MAQKNFTLTNTSSSSALFKWMELYFSTLKLSDNDWKNGSTF